MRHASETKEIPVIFYTVLEEKDLEEKLRETATTNKTFYVPKDTNPSTLIQAIKNLLTNHQDLANKS